MEMSGKTHEQVVAYINSKIEKDGITRAAFYAACRNPASRSGQIIARLEAEKAQAKPQAEVDVSDLLG